MGEFQQPDGSTTTAATPKLPETSAMTTPHNPTEERERVMKAIFDEIWPRQDWDGDESFCMRTAEITADAVLTALRRPAPPEEAVERVARAIGDVQVHDPFLGPTPIRGVLGQLYLEEAARAALSAAPTMEQVRAEERADWLSQDDAECELKDAIDGSLGPPGDDKPILAELKKQGVWLARFGPLSTNTKGPE